MDKHRCTTIEAVSHGQQATLETDLPRHACRPCHTFAAALHVPGLPHSDAPCHSRAQLTSSTAGCRSAEASDAVCLEEASHFARMLFYQRLRTPADRQQVAALFESVWGASIMAHTTPELSTSPQWVQVGRAGLARPGSNYPKTGHSVAPISCKLGQQWLWQARSSMAP